MRRWWFWVGITSFLSSESEASGVNMAHPGVQGVCVCARLITGRWDNRFGGRESVGLQYYN